MVIQRYSPEHKAEWDNFISRSRCGTFLFYRDYMDYHADRFADFSLMAFNHRGKLMALLPAELNGDTLSSHRGLTYGGWIIPVRHFDGYTMSELMDSTVSFLKETGISHLIYKPLPYIYPTMPMQEDLYALHRHGAVITECSLSSVIYLKHPAPMNESTRQAIKLADKSEVEISESHNLDIFWQILEECLHTRHDATPVHSLEEIKRLKELFPENIRLIVASRCGKIIAVALLYICRRVVRIQYMASNPEGRQVKALSLLVSNLIEKYGASHDFLDMGTSNNPSDGSLNEGLLLFKSGLGGKGVIFSTWRINLP